MFDSEIESEEGCYLGHFQRTGSSLWWTDARNCKRCPLVSHLAIKGSKPSAVECSLKAKPDVRSSLPPSLPTAIAIASLLFRCECDLLISSWNAHAPETAETSETSGHWVHFPACALLKLRASGDNADYNGTKNCRPLSSFQLRRSRGRQVW